MEVYEFNECGEISKKDLKFKTLWCLFQYDNGDFNNIIGKKPFVFDTKEDACEYMKKNSWTGNWVLRKLSFMD